MQVLDLTPDPLWADQEPLKSLAWITDSSAIPEPASPILLRASSLPQHDFRCMLPQVDHWIAVVSGQKESLHRAVESRQFTDAYLPSCGGTIAWTERPEGRIREVADVVSCFLAKRFS
jgi:hypothetical protein